MECLLAARDPRAGPVLAANQPIIARRWSADSLYGARAAALLARAAGRQAR